MFCIDSLLAFITVIAGMYLVVSMSRLARHIKMLLRAYKISRASAYHKREAEVRRCSGVAHLHYQDSEAHNRQPSKVGSWRITNATHGLDVTLVRTFGHNVPTLLVQHRHLS
jgi:hypothetical protein